MENKILFLAIFLGIFAIMLSANVASTELSNITAPTNGTNYTSTVFFNVTFSNTTDSNVTNPTKAQFFYNTTGGTWTVIGNITTCYYQLPGTLGECRGNLSISTVPDGKYSINVTLWNATNSGVNVSKMPINVTFDSTPPAVSIFFNGVAALNGVNSTLMNSSVNYTIYDTLGIGSCWFYNGSGTVNISLPNCATNISGINWTTGFTTVRVYVNNSVGLVNYTDITFGRNNFTPVISVPTLPINGGNYSRTIMLRVLITDTLGLSKVFFNITNSTSGGGQTVSYNATKDGATDYWNYSLNTAGFADGNVYNISIWANNSVGLFNSTHNVSGIYRAVSVTFDNTAPSTPTLASSTITSGSIAATITVSDGLSGIYTSCSVNNRPSASISGTTGTQTLTETGLACGSIYHYAVTCSDLVGNSASSVTYSYTTSDCGSGSSGGGGGGATTVTWAMTYSPETTQLASSEGYTQQLASNERVSVPVGTGTHYVGVTSLTATKATIEISSNPVTVNLEVGEEAKVDVDNDGTYDVYVKLNSIVSSKADVTIKKISEAVPAGSTGVETTGEQVTTPAGGAGETGAVLDYKWLWWVLGIIVVAVVIAVIVMKKKR